MTRKKKNQGILSIGEVARLFGVTTSTIDRWTESGKLSCFHTLGGHRRFRREDVERLLPLPILTYELTELGKKTISRSSTTEDGRYLFVTWAGVDVSVSEALAAGLIKERG